MFSQAIHILPNMPVKEPALKPCTAARIITSRANRVDRKLFFDQISPTLPMVRLLVLLFMGYIAPSFSD